MGKGKSSTGMTTNSKSKVASLSQSTPGTSGLPNEPGTGPFAGVDVCSQAKDFFRKVYDRYCYHSGDDADAVSSFEDVFLDEAIQDCISGSETCLVFATPPPSIHAEEVENSSAHSSEVQGQSKKRKIGETVTIVEHTVEGEKVMEISEDNLLEALKLLAPIVRLGFLDPRNIVLYYLGEIEKWNVARKHSEPWEEEASVRQLKLVTESIKSTEVKVKTELIQKSMLAAQQKNLLVRQKKDGNLDASLNRDTLENCTRAGKYALELCFALFDKDITGVLFLHLLGLNKTMLERMALGTRAALFMLLSGMIEVEHNSVPSAVMNAIHAMVWVHVPAAHKILQILLTDDYEKLPDSIKESISPPTSKGKGLGLGPGLFIPGTNFPLYMHLSYMFCGSYKTTEENPTFVSMLQSKVTVKSQIHQKKSVLRKEITEHEIIKLLEMETNFALARQKMALEVDVGIEENAILKAKAKKHKVSNYEQKFAKVLSTCPIDQSEEATIAWAKLSIGTRLAYMLSRTDKQLNKRGLKIDLANFEAKGVMETTVLDFVTDWLNSEEPLQQNDFT